MKQITTKHGEMLIRYENDFISQELIKHGQYEWYVVEILAELAKGHDDGIILDIGANVGTITLPIAKMFPQYHVHAFEVQSTVADMLVANIELNKLNNVTVHRFGLSNEATVKSVRHPDYDTAQNIGAFSLSEFVRDKSDEAKVTGDEEFIKLVTLDSMPSNSPIRAIKMDVEGYERFVIEGGIETLKQHNYPPIVYELWGYQPWWKEEAAKLNDLLISLGYKLQKVDDTGIAKHP